MREMQQADGISGRNGRDTRLFLQGPIELMHVNLVKGEPMSRVFILPALLALVLLPGAASAGPTPPPDAVKAAPNQFYGPWKELKNYWHRSYFFKVSPTDKDFQQHEVIFYKKDPRFYYYYSPESGQFWGRGFVNKGCHGDELYQFLQPGERAGDLKDVNFNSKPVEAPPKLGAVNPPATPPANTPATPPATAPGATGLKGDQIGGLPVAKGPRLKLPPDEPPPAFAAPVGG
jgi:hypothetical protein